MDISSIATGWPRAGQDIAHIELRDNNVYIQAANGDIWRVSIDWNRQPVIELAARGAPVPE